MDIKQFKDFCKKELELRGFEKIKKMFYCLGKDVLCGIELQKSNYGNRYYVNYYFFIGNFNIAIEYPERYDLDVQGRIVVMSKSQTVGGKHFLTSMIEYEEYTEEELRLYFDKEFEKKIIPPIRQGKTYILENLGKLYSLTLRKEEVMRKLQT